jgi:Putative auto-transporter adhesin, head GIN domain
MLSNKKALSTIMVVAIVVVVIVAALIIAALAIFLLYLPVVIEKTQSFTNTDFNALDISSAFNVNITQSNSYSITITANQRIMDQIEVKQNGNLLTIDVKPGSILGSFNAKAQITMPKLEKVTFSGATSGTAIGFNSDEPLKAKISGASSLKLTDFQSADITVDVSGASSLTAKGSANNLSAIVSGASNLDLLDLAINDANVNLSGASHATINLDGRLDANASGASSLQYTGNPTLGTINTSGASSVNKK